MASPRRPPTVPLKFRRGRSLVAAGDCLETNLGATAFPRQARDPSMNSPLYFATTFVL